jgi:ubiquinone/menaquinone biosynthesis C-methylase UbiE
MGVFARLRFHQPYRLFNRIAPIYQWLTHTPLWADSVHALARHLPPSGSQLQALDVGCGTANAALILTEKRGDVQVTGIDASQVMIQRGQALVNRSDRRDRIRLFVGNAETLPFADQSFDALFTHSVFYMLDHPDQFLREALRVLRPGGRLILLEPAQLTGINWSTLRQYPRAAPSLLTWSAVARAYTRFTPEGLARLLIASGFERVLGESAVEGFGVLARGEKAFAGVALDTAPITTTTRQTPYLYLLIRQTPNKPVWAITPTDQIEWQALTVESNGVRGVIAFSSLPKAVAFMQPAVLSGALKDIHRIAKYPRDSVEQFGLPIRLNPDLSAIQGAQMVQVDRLRAVTGEE